MTDKPENGSDSEAAARGARRSSLMHVGRRVDYAVRALAYLAAQPDGRVVGRAEIEARQHIPRSFLAKILRRLVAAGLLESVAGVGGGFRLCRSPATVTIRQVYEAVEGELALIDCLRGDVCSFDPVCSQIDVWRGAQRRLAAYLEGISIADVADPQGLNARLAAARERARS
ncbi:Rrf2 family transcriptional regulator [bacterium]|nr:Rrf2 family transcriptional regulator [bacterium]